MNQDPKETQEITTLSQSSEPIRGDALLLEGDASEVTVFTQYYVATRASLRAYLATLLKDDAACEDCMQEAVLVMWKKREAQWELEDFRKLAFTCARFKALSWLKKNKPKNHLNLSPELSEKLAQKAANSADTAPEGRVERVNALRACVEDLPPKQKEMIKARYESSGSGELAALAKKSESKMSAIYKKLERTRAALRQCVESKMKALR